MDKYGERDKRLMAAFLMGETRRENDGSVVTMDPAVLEEMLRWLPPTDYWDAATASPSIVVSPDTRRVSMRSSNIGLGIWDCVMSIDPMDDFTVRVFSGSGNAVCTFIGFTTRDAFKPKFDVYRDKMCGLYILRCDTGLALGSGIYKEGYGPKNSMGGTVRCVADRARGTISFHVDGVDHGVALMNVPPVPLYAVAMFVFRDIVEFV